MKREFIEFDGGRVLVTDTITILTQQDDGAVIVSGSHGGVSSAQFVMGRAFIAVFYNDAGGGKDNAGIAGLVILDRIGVPALAISSDSAEIGNGMDAWRNGVVSAANDAARRLGVDSGMSVQAAAGRLIGSGATSTEAREPPKLRRTGVALDGLSVTLLDSVSMIGDQDRGAIVATGSHGGAVSADFALERQPAFVAFNDAGGGRNMAGCASLPILGAAGIAAATVGCRSARIGEPVETLELGIVSHVNGPASEIGLRPGLRLGEQLRAHGERILRRFGNPAAAG